MVLRHLGSGRSGALIPQVRGSLASPVRLGPPFPEGVSGKCQKPRLTFPRQARRGTWHGGSIQAKGCLLGGNPRFQGPPSQLVVRVVQSVMRFQIKL